MLQHAHGEIAEYRFRFGVLVDLVLADLADELFEQSFRRTERHVDLATATANLDILQRIAACEHFLISYELLSSSEFETVFATNANDSSRCLLHSIGNHDADDDECVATCLGAGANDDWPPARRARVLRAFCGVIGVVGVHLYKVCPLMTTNYQSAGKYRTSFKQSLYIQVRLVVVYQSCSHVSFILTAVWPNWSTHCAIVCHARCATRHFREICIVARRAFVCGCGAWQRRVGRIFGEKRRTVRRQN